MDEILKNIKIISVFAIVMPLIYWFASYRMHESTTGWPNSKTNLNLDEDVISDLKQGWDLKPVSQDSSVLVVNFWFKPPFTNEVFVSLKVSEAGTGLVSVKSKESWSDSNRRPGLTIEKENLLIDKSKIYELNEVFSNVRYWETPPGENQGACTDGSAYIIETIRDDDVRSWINACSPSKEMNLLAKYFLSFTKYAY